MSEFYPDNHERVEAFDRGRALEQIIDSYLGDDKEYLLEEHDLEDRIGAVYGMLLELGEDPDIVLTEAGVLEKEENDDEV